MNAFAKSNDGSLRTVWALSSVAGAFWFAMFSPWTKDTLNFWATMLIATGVLGASALWLGKDELARVYRFETRHLLMGLLFAAGLYAVFKVGHVVSTSLFPFAAGQIDNIYATRTQASPSTIALALLLWIGPSEEVFWRGFVQDRLMRRYGDVAGFVVTTAIYSLVHIWAFNFMLFGAALICGLFWGLVYMRTRSLWPGLISHAVWDATIFVFLPIT